MTAKKLLVWGYVAIAVLTLAFQISVRSSQCLDASDCGASFAKGLVWSLVWPASWAVYLKGKV
jgi:hypothetical protein